MDAFTAIIFDAVKAMDPDMSKVRASGEGAVTHRQRTEVIAAYLKSFFYDWAATSPPTQRFVGEIVVEAFEHRVDWYRIAESILTVPELN